MKNLHFMTAQQSYKFALREMERYNFTLSSKGAGSYYYNKAGCPWKIRISEHKSTERKHDVLVDLVFDYPTIQSDVEIRVNRALTEFERNRNRLIRQAH